MAKALSGYKPNITAYWEGTDTQEAFQKNWQKRQAALTTAGYTNNTTIEYKSDRLGFRNPKDITINDSVLALGCSITFGTGLHRTETWPHLLSEQLSISVYNAGVGGGSNDRNFRMLDALLGTHKPKAVMLLATYAHRYEQYDYKSNEHVTFYAQHHDDRWLSDETHSLLHQKKNILAMNMLCHQRNIPFICIDLENISSDGFQQDARDLIHPGAADQQKFAESFRLKYLQHFC